MQFGVCTAVKNGALLRTAGWDYIEANVQELLQPELPDAQWNGDELAASAALPVEAGNLLVPGQMKITGPTADFPRLRTYMEKVMERASRVGIKTLVFGAGNARKVEQGVDMETARDQVRAFVAMATELAGERGIILVAEPLNRKECNILNSVGEAMEYVRAVGQPSFQCLVDSYHFWEEEAGGDAVGEREARGEGGDKGGKEGVAWEDLAAAVPWIRHVHVADKGSRLAPGQSLASGEREYVRFFSVLKRGGYDGRISVESGWKPDLARDAGTVLERLKHWWDKA